MPNYMDIDYVVENEINGFVNSFLQQYMSQIPTTVLADKAKLLKHIKEFYSSKGTPKSYQLLFRILFNKPIDLLLNTGTQVLKASAGQWYQPTVLRITPIITESSFNNVRIGQNFIVGQVPVGNPNPSFSYNDVTDWVNLQIFGETSFASAIVNSAVTNFQFNFQYDELTISNITKSFLPNEIIRSVTPQGEIISGTLLGIVPGITIVNPGSKYNIGDPVLIVGGGGANAEAHISQVSTGSIIGISVSDSGSGIQTYPNFQLQITGSQTPTVAQITSVDVSGLVSPNNYIINTDLLANSNNSSLILNSPYKLISNSWNVTTYANCGPVQVVKIISGGNFANTPNISLTQNVPIGNTNLDIVQFGAIGTLKIINPGLNYAVNDDIKIVSTLSRGVAAGGIVTSVNAAGSITSVYIALPSIDGKANVTSGSNNVIGSGTKFTTELWANNNVTYANSGSYITINGETHRVANIVNNTVLFTDSNYLNTATNKAVRLQGFTLGGFGYIQSDLPYNVQCYVNSINGTGAIIYADSIAGSGVTFTPSTVTYGQIISIAMDSFGDHYSSAPIINLTQSGDGTAVAIADLISGEFQYPGYYLNEDGMLSARRYLEDATNYNNYTYKLETKVAVSAYYDLVYNLLNPAGMNMQCITRICPITNNIQDFNSDAVTYLNFGAGPPPPPPIPPNKVTNLVATSQNTDSILLTWTLPTIGQPAPTFTVQYRKTGNTTFLIGPSTSTAGATVTGLIANTQYDFDVIAFNIGGSATSNIVTGTTFALPPVPVAPGQVTGVTTIPIGTNTMRVTWVLPIIGTPPYNFKVLYRANGVSTFIIGANTTNTTADIIGLITATLYDFEVFANNSVGNSTSNVVTASTNSTSIPDIDINFILDLSTLGGGIPGSNVDTNFTVGFSQVS